MIWNLIGSIGGKVLDIVDDVVEANRLKFQIQKQLIENNANEHLATRSLLAALRRTNPASILPPAIRHLGNSSAAP